MVLSRDAIWGDCSAWRELESLTVLATRSTDLIIITMASGQKVAKDFNFQSSIFNSSAQVLLQPIHPFRYIFQ